MTTYLFHGENQPALRDALLELKKEYKEAVSWEKDLEELGPYLLSPSFFSEKELVIVENPELGELTKLIELIKKGAKDVVLAFSDKIPPKKLPKGGGVKVLHFREEIPKSVFPFLDALAAKNRRGAFAQAHRLFQAGEDIHFLLTMMVWQMRNLARVKGGSVKGIHPYALGKLKRVEKNFNQAELSRAFSLLLKEDLAAKKGKASSATLDFLIDKLTY